MKKAKYPTLAASLTFIFPGIGQIYACKIVRGLSFLFLFILILVIFMGFILSETSLYLPYTVAMPLMLVFYCWVGIDAYRCARVFNQNNNLEFTSSKAAAILLPLIIISIAISTQNIIALLIRNYFVQAYQIKSGTMEPTLQINDRVLIKKYDYKNKTPQRGDVVAFLDPTNKTALLIKRVAGLPEEEIAIKDGKIYVDKKMLMYPTIFKERYYANFDMYGKEDQQIKIDKDYFYVIADYGKRALDSRRFGPIHRSQIVGRVYKVLRTKK